VNASNLPLSISSCSSPVPLFAPTFKNGGARGSDASAKDITTVQLDLKELTCGSLKFQIYSHF